MALHESGEDYLEAILVIQEKKGAARSIDVAQYLGYSKPSVSRAVALLKTGGYVVMERDGRLTLTEVGLQVAREIYERHKLLTAWLIGLGVAPETAAEDACKIEHDISAQTFQCLKEYMSQ